MPLRKVLSLKVGDTLMLNTRPNDLVTLRCGDWTLTQGRTGRIDDKIAIQVTRPLRRSRTTLAAFEAGLSKKDS
jgi:flagellar motor switch protein FliM